MKKQIIEILSEICPGIDFETETALIDDGLIDSLDIVAVVTELMEAFDVELGVDALAAYFRCDLHIDGADSFELR